jgi:small subunit ribosomal protein S4
MARYTGPKDKISRRFGVAIFGPTKALERRAFGPGQHGARSGRKKQSDYCVALGEKQKLRYQYGMMEKPFRRFFAEAQRRKGVTGEILLQMLELRLDNVIYRLGFANSRNAARQYVCHGHVRVNGGKVNIPSYQCKAGDIVTMKDTARSQQLGQRAVDLTQAVPTPEWVSVDRDKLAGIVVRVPSREEIDPLVNEQLIVELYSR